MSGVQVRIRAGTADMKVSLAGRCPRCGEGKLFAGFLNLAPACDKCGLSYDRLDQGDGPAVFIILIAGFIVAEPFNAAAEIMGVGKVLRFTADVWRDHACCLTLMHEHDLQKRPQWVQKVVNALVKAQAWTLDHRAETAALMAKGGRNQYTPHSEEALLRVLHPAKPQWDSYAKSGVLRHPQWMQQRIDFQPFPFPSYTEELVRMLKKTYVAGNNSFLDALEPAKVAAELVEPRFVRQAIEQQKAQALFRLPADFTRREEISA